MKRLLKKIENMTLAQFVILSITNVIIFTIVVLAYNYHGLEVQDSLIDKFFYVFGGEVLICGLIKIFKLGPFRKKEEDDDAAG